MIETREKSPSPRRVAAGKINALKREPLSPEARERLRQAAIEHQPWRFSTGPRTAAGKAKVALNGRHRQCGPVSLRQLRKDLAKITQLAKEMQGTRQGLM